MASVMFDGIGLVSVRAGLRSCISAASVGSGLIWALNTSLICEPLDLRGKVVLSPPCSLRGIGSASLNQASASISGLFFFPRVTASPVFHVEQSSKGFPHQCSTWNIRVRPPELERKSRTYTRLSATNSTGNFAFPHQVHSATRFPLCRALRVGRDSGTLETSLDILGNAHP